MLAVANYSMKGPLQAFIATVLFSALTVWLAPFGLVVGAIIALTTLRVSLVEGFKTLAVASLTNILLSTALMGSAIPGMVSMLEYMLPIWVAAVVLRNTNSLALSLSSILGMAGLMVLMFHLVVGDTQAWWAQLYTEQFLPMIQQAGIDSKEFDLTQIIPMVTMLIAIFAVTLWFSILLLGRWWQSKLYYPGRFQEDFYQLRLSKGIAYITVVFAVLGLVFSESDLVKNLSSVLMTGLMFQGLAIAHHAAHLRSLNTAWLVGLYVLLLLFPQTLLILATLGLLDVWIDFRSRWQKQ